MRAGIALVLAAALVVGGASTALGDPNSGQLVVATIYRSGQPPAHASVSIGSLESNSNCERYSGPGIDLHGPGANPAQQFTSRAWRLSTVLECLSEPVFTNEITVVTVRQTDGSPQWAGASQLHRGDLVPPSDFADDDAVPVVWSDGSNILYYRPWRGGSDENARDLVQQPSPSSFEVDVFTGRPLDVAATASETTVTEGATVDFSASVSPGDASGLSYSWNFGGGAPSSTQAAPRVRFGTPGRYKVTAQVTDDAGGGGGDVLQVTVNSENGTPPTEGSPSDPQTGPDNSQGSNPGGPPGNQGGGPTGKPGGTGRGDPDGGKRGRDREPGAADTTGSGGGPSSGTGPGSGSSDSPGGTDKEQGDEGSSSPLKPAPSSTDDEGDVVTGRLISKVTGLPAGASPLVRTVQESVASAPARRVVKSSPLAIVGGALGIVLLLGLGARRELRWR
jgi:hypothetical protein